MTVEKDKSTLESKEFWEVIEAAAAEVTSWPAWKRAGWQTSATERRNAAERETGQGLSGRSGDEEAEP